MSDVRSWSRCRRSTRLWLCVALCMLPLWACSSAHGPTGSTETGNPPVIDLLRVALKVSAEAVLITGETGAVTPGEASIEITNLTTGAMTMTVANADGSFSVQVDGSANDAFVVRAKADGVSSKAVYVVRGGASVGTGSGDALSCEQRDQLAGAQLQLTAAGADAHCSADADCSAVNEFASCHSRCQYAVVSSAGRRELDATSAAIDAGLCASYAQDGCPSVVVPCPVPLPAICSAGQCMLADGNMTMTNSMSSTLSCQERDQLAGDQLQRVAQAADRSCKLDVDCQTVSLAASCHGSCDNAVVSSAGQQTIEAAKAALTTGVCANFDQEGCSSPSGPCALPPVGVCTAGMCVPSVSALTCQAREQLASTSLMQATDMLDLACAVDTDCASVPIQLTCHDTCGFAPIVSQTGKTRLDSAVAMTEASVCDGFHAAGCSFNALPCLPSTPGTAICSAGQCASLPACTSCFTQHIAWGYVDGDVAYRDESSIEPCVHYQSTHTLAGATVPMSKCHAELLACNAVASTGAVQTALSDADVERALAASPSLYGLDRRAVDMPIFQIKVDDRTLQVGDECPVTSSSCTPIPQGVAALVELLKQIDQFGQSGSNCERYIP